MWNEEYMENFENLEVIQNYERTLELYREDPQKWAKDYVRDLINLGGAYRDNKNYRKAVELYERALSIAEELYQEEPKIWAQDYVSIVINSGNIHCELDEYEKAMDIYERALGVIDEILGEGPKTSAEMEDYYKVLEQ